MEKIEKSVFISYRRDDISWALLVYKDLREKGYDVFFDYLSIPSGDFRQIILGNIKARAHFLLILTPTALDRCCEPGDWLRYEVETALLEKRNIIPLFFNDFEFKAPSVSKNLTGELGRIKEYNGLEVPPAYFDEAMQRLRERYLNVDLDTVLHPISDEVKEVVIEQQVAADREISRRTRAEEKASRDIEERESKEPRVMVQVDKLDEVHANLMGSAIGGKVNHKTWLNTIFTQMEQFGTEGQEAASFLRRRNTKVGFKRAKSNVGAFWTIGGGIYLNSHYYSYDKSLNDPRVITLLIHEARHLQQGIFTALSVYGELDAWQLEFGIYHRMKGRYPHPAIEELMSLPLGWDRDVLRRAVECMHGYSGKGYRADLLPLYPIGKEIAYRLFRKVPVSNA